MIFGYCGNVHPSRNLEELQHSLEDYTLDVKRQFSPDTPMGIGLWLSATTSQELENRDTLMRFKDWLGNAGLIPYTLNGFPFGDFHQDVVKLDVYRPTWAEPERLNYTVQLAEILNVLLPEDEPGTISTLPLGWPTEGNHSYLNDESFWKQCSRNLTRLAEHLDSIRQSNGRQLMVCIEPEPGCLLDTATDIVSYFDQQLLVGDENSNERIRNHIGVCHDICHSAVMFEPQSEAVNAYVDAGVQIGKVQVSSAITADFDECEDMESKARLLDRLSQFSEPRYMHQTSIKQGDEQTLFDDLHLAQASAGREPNGKWRIHFHVPIFAPELGLLGTTQNDIIDFFEAINQRQLPVPQCEIETYAWNVLPEQYRTGSLSDGIANELSWFQDKVIANRDA